MKKIIFFILFGCFLFNVALAQNNEKKVELYYFWGNGCQYCEEAKPFLEQLKKEYPEVLFKEYEVYENEQNMILFNLIVNAYGQEVQGTPTWITGNNLIAGYANFMEADIHRMIKDCLDQQCPSPRSWLTTDSQPSQLLEEPDDLLTNVQYRNPGIRTFVGAIFVIGVFLIFLFLIQHLIKRNYN